MSLLRFTRTSQPQQPVSIDRNNPITRGLVFASCDLMAASSASGHSQIKSGTGFEKSLLQSGIGTRAGSTQATTGVVSLPVSVRDSLVSKPCTFFWLSNRPQASANGQHIYCHRDSSVADFLVQFNVTGYSVIVGANTSANVSLSASGNVAVAVVLDGASCHVYQNKAKTTNAFAFLPTVSSIIPSVLNRQTGGRGVTAYVPQIAIWNRALSDEEIKSLSDNPWQIFQPTNRAIYPEATAAGSTYTLTADAASYSITGADASLIVNRKLIADTANIPIAGADATLTYTPIGGPTYTLTADAGSYAITGNATGLAFNRVLTADAGSYSVAGQAVGLAFNRVLSAATANIPVAGQDVTLTYTNNGFTYTLSAEAGAFSVTGQDARLVWSGEQTGFTNEVVLKPWYIRRNKKILLFGTAQEADAYIEAEEVAEQAIQEAQKTSRRARKRLRDKLITIEPIQTVDVDQLAEAIERFSIPVDLPKLIAQQDYERVMQILALAADMQDEEDIETLLLM